MTVLEVVAAEVERQDAVHSGGYGVSRDGVRLGLASIEDELRETLEAWHGEKKMPRSPGRSEWNCGCVIADDFVVSRGERMSVVRGDGLRPCMFHEEGAHLRWPKTRGELLQLVAVAVRTLRPLVEAPVEEPVLAEGERFYTREEVTAALWSGEYDHLTGGEFRARFPLAPTALATVAS